MSELSMDREEKQRGRDKAYENKEDTSKRGDWRKTLTPIASSVGAIILVLGFLYNIILQSEKRITDRMARMESRIEQRLDRIGARLENLESRLNESNQRISKIEGRLER